MDVKNGDLLLNKILEYSEIQPDKIALYLNNRHPDQKGMWFPNL